MTPFSRFFIHQLGSIRKRKKHIENQIWEFVSNVGNQHLFTKGKTIIMPNGDVRLVPLRFYVFQFFGKMEKLFVENGEINDDCVKNYDLM